MARTKQTARDTQGGKAPRGSKQPPASSQGKGGKAPRKNGAAAAIAVRPGGAGKEKVRRRKNAGSNAIRKIRKQQKRTDYIIPLAPLKRLISTIMERDSVLYPATYKIGEGKYSKASNEWRIRTGARVGLRTYLENVMVATFRASAKIPPHCKRTTLYPRDMDLAFNIITDGEKVPAVENLERFTKTGERK